MNVPAVESGYFLVFSENTTLPGDSQLFVNKKNKGRNSFSHYRRPPTLESTLSEILSPVDEVLSYGSAELPPPVKPGSAICLDSDACLHPPPAFEVITWTSEDEHPAPAVSVEDLSINSENLPPLPVDSLLNSQESNSLGSISLREKEGNHKSNGDLCEDTEEKSSLHTRFCIRNETSDLSFSSQIVDRILRCNLMPKALKSEAPTTIVPGFLAGDALEGPTGNHNGNFRGVDIFRCHKKQSDIELIDRGQSTDERGEDFPDEMTQRITRGERLVDTSFDVRLNESPSAIESILEDIKCSQLKEPKQCRYSWRTPSPICEMSPLREAGNIEGDFVTHGVLDQWPQTQSKMPANIKVRTHEEMIVYRLVNTSVEILCGQANKDSLHLCETPSYLLDSDSSKQYRQVIYELTSDVLNEILGHPSMTKKSAKKSRDRPAVSALQSNKVSITFLKASVRREVQKILNLERNEQQIKEMFRKLCKYWSAKRDRVDFILIQELHREERSWLNYQPDQLTVTFHLTEEIFSLLLEDTILTLNHMPFGI